MVEFSIMETVLFILAFIAIYALPSFIAIARDIPGKTLVVVLNISLGFSIIGWILPLIWALTPAQPKSA